MEERSSPSRGHSTFKETEDSESTQDSHFVRRADMWRPVLKGFICPAKE
jgi:hypothetical protein